MSKPSPEVSNLSAVRRDLVLLRDALLQLHKVLVESERVEYEKAFGPIASPNDFLRLLSRDPWFAWLSPLTQLLVRMDEMLDEGEPITEQGKKEIFASAFELLVTDEAGAGFGKHYFDALQRDPDVVMAYAEVAKLKRKT